ncbi:MAG: non-hydrolyzing UDP-N-acetylglucosamine 2-epimerase [Candidatus Hodarchaeota archaeon]
MATNKILIVGGARPNFMKIAPLIKQFEINNLNYKFIHTGQHYDYNMSKIFFDNLKMPEPDIFLSVGSGSHAWQTAKIMIEFEKVIIKEKPSLVIVVGDVNSTIACALVAKKLFIDVAHVEAGLRSFDMRMPEEINRILTDQISDLLFITERSALENLKREGIATNKIFHVGNVMIDNLIMNLDRAKNLDYNNKFNLKRGSYALVTVHRPSNVDSKGDLTYIVNILNYLQKKIKIIFPIHPRTRKNLTKYGLINKLNDANINLIKPIGYLEFLSLMMNARLILTDSGGIQEEATFLKIPTLTLRQNTERPITVEKGTNLIIDRDLEKLKIYLEKILANSYKKGLDIEKWDGKAAERIISILKKHYNIK